MKPKEFIALYHDQAVLSQNKHGVPALLTLAQAALESGWGEHAPGNNFFGIKDSAAENFGTQTKLTKEFIKGQMVTIEQTFETFPSALECFEAHAKLMRRVWPGAFDFKDPLEFIAYIQSQKKKYATDPGYVQKIAAMLNTLKKAAANGK